MTAKILDGKALAEEIRGEVATGVAEMQEKHGVTPGLAAVLVGDDPADRKSTRLNSSHVVISYAVFCLKKNTHISVTTATV